MRLGGEPPIPTTSIISSRGDRWRAHLTPPSSSFRPVRQVILGTKTYGRATNDRFDTSKELGFIIDSKKPYFLIKMCVRLSSPTPPLCTSLSISSGPHLITTPLGHHAPLVTHRLYCPRLVTRGRCDRFEEATTRFQFDSGIMWTPWTPGEPMPDDLPKKIFQKAQRSA